MKKIFYIFIAAAIIGGFLSIDNDVYAAPTGATLATGDDTYSLNWYDTDGNGVNHHYDVTYNKNDTLQSVTIYSNNGTKTERFAAPTNPAIKKNSTEEAAFFADKIPGGQASYAIADAQAKSNGNVINKDAPNKSSGASVTECVEWVALTRWQINWGSCIAEAFNLVVLRITAFFLWVAGWLFNYSLGYSLNMGDFLKNVPIVDVGWKIMRDVANLCFIFILLYIAINTILQTKSADTKRLLIRVVIVAILLNFSLFFAKVVIDSSNILAYQFYEKMGGKETSGPFTGKLSLDEASNAKGISQVLLKGLGLEGIYKMGGEGKSGQETKAPTISNVLAISIGGALLIMVTAFVLIAASIMFIIRTIVLIFLLVLAPLAFLSMVLPQTESYWKKWIGMLLNQSFFAPLYMMLMYLVVAIVSGKYGGNIKGQVLDGSTNLGTFLTGNQDAVGSLYVFVVLIALMLGSLIIAKSLGAVGGDFARNIAGKATFGASGWLGRKTAGRAFDSLTQTERFKRMKDANYSGMNPLRHMLVASQRGIASKIESGAKGTWDVRNSAIGKAVTSSQVGSLGDVGGEGGYQKFREEEKKRENAQAFFKKKDDVQSVLGKAGSTDEDIQNELKKLTPSEFGKLGKEMLTNERILRNASPEQRKAALDEKNENIDSITRTAIRQGVYKDVNAAVQSGNSDRIKKALKRLSVDEKAELPDEVVNNHQVYTHFDKDTRDAIKKSGKITQAAKDKMTDKRAVDLRNGLNAATRNLDKIKAATKNLSGEDLFDAIGNAVTDPEVVKHLTEDQLKDLEKTTLSGADRDTIGTLIRANRNYPGYMYVKAGAPAVPAIGGASPRGEIKAGDGFERW